MKIEKYWISITKVGMLVSFGILGLISMLTGNIPKIYNKQGKQMKAITDLALPSNRLW